ncbi:Non-specific serine/threonine protein kinase [Bertholletia excelsa]
MGSHHSLLLCFLLLSFLTISTSFNILTANQSIKDGETLASEGDCFELGFFSSGGNRYLGIWYKKMATGTVVWVANRDVPINDTSGVLILAGEGRLDLLNHAGTIIWSSNSSKTGNNPVAQLLDTGNLVVTENGNYDNEGKVLWQSFDYPSDTLLPGMKVGIDTLTGLDRYLTAWWSSDDPGRSGFTFRLDPSGFPQFLVRNGSVEKFRLGPWNGLRFSGMPNLKPNPIFTFYFVLDQQEIYYGYQLKNNSVITRLMLNPSGLLQRYIWINRTQGWILYTNAQMDNCDTYAMCGAYGSCVIGNSPACGCLKGFEPKNQAQWGVADWSDGCVRKVKLECGKRDGFLKYSNLKLPDTRHSYFNQSMNLEECRSLCLENCSCTAYANTDIRNGGSGCFLWFGDLIDIRDYSTDGQDLYVKMAASELGHIFNYGREKEDGELPLFDLASILMATNNFSDDNKIGEGGFGPVYKGVLENGQEIAVKTLSKDSKQGDEEFKNEVIYIARLQHRNLVKLLGYCLQGEEKMLIYEYMPNKSLDFFIFDQEQNNLVDWPKRFNIIKGIARGLLYLHQDSRLQIIHRDLKASNILLDHEMNPKISDFGTARSFGGNETEANTNRVVGTCGYMSPEYVMDGQFSVKSDVFSFGVMILEIVSGRKNRHIGQPGHLTGLAWKLFEEGRTMELINESLLEESSNESEMLRAIHVGLLCVQQRPEDRPEMSTVVVMLVGDGALPLPKQPGFFTERSLVLEAAVNSSPRMLESANLLTITTVEAR